MWGYEVLRTLRRRLTRLVLDVVGFLVPVFTFVPNTWMFWGIMSMPLIAYFSSTAYVPHLWDEIVRMLFDFSFLTGWHGSEELVVVLLFGGIIILARAMFIGGSVFFVYSLLFLYGKRDGLVTDGPYGRIRHPQYLAIILMTAGVTIFAFWSNPVWVWGRSAVSLPQASILAVWALEVAAYLVLAKIEEMHLASRFGEQYARYSRSVPFMSPLRLLRRHGPSTKQTESGAEGRRES